MAKLRAEFAAGAPQPDVLLIADTVTMEGLDRFCRDPRQLPQRQQFEAWHEITRPLYDTSPMACGGIVHPVPGRRLQGCFDQLV